jgi:demethylmenaquinone methyltransferase / 2-methoxy-6-polyprenyl-1,4-benzoquinol methylase
MFDDIVGRYDLVNGLLSLGLDRVWRRAAIRAVPFGPGDRILDLGCGTGDLSRQLARAGARPVGLDVSHRMLVEANRKLSDAGALVQGSAFSLPFADGAFAGAVSGFVLRNLNDLRRAFDELARVIRPGGRIGLVDITEPRSRVVRRGFDAYFGTVVPALGGLIGKREAYRYLARSLGQLPPPAEVCQMLEAAGFRDVAGRALTGGMVTLFTGTCG